LYAFLKEKLLTIIKKYFIDVIVSYTRLDSVYNRQWIDHRHNSNGRIHWNRRILHVQNMGFWGKNVQLEQKKSF
jgi:hypothetical protein